MITGTATTSACWNELSPSDFCRAGPSGLSSAQAQKFTTKPTVATSRMTPRRRAAVGSARGAAAGGV